MASVDIRDDMKTPRILISSAVCAAVILLASMFGCNGGIGDFEPPPLNDYRLDGVLVKDINTGSNRVAILILKDGSMLPGAEVLFGSDTLSFNVGGFPIGGVYSTTVSPVTAIDSGSFVVSMNDPGNFNDTVHTFVADTFAITAVTPFNRIIQGNGSATLEWTTPGGVDGFAVAAVLASEAYTGAGWSVFSSLSAGAGTIVPDAFLSADGLNPDTGLYNLYVYAYSGNPDSVLSASLLPVPFPQQLGDLVARPGFNSRFGTIVVTLVDTVRVTFIP